MTIDSREKLIEIREEEQKKIESCDCRILVCSGTGCIATGSQKIYERFLEIAKDAPGVTIEFGPHDKDLHVGVKKTAGTDSARRPGGAVYEGTADRLRGNFRTDCA